MKASDPQRLARQIEGRGLPPVEKWNPPLSGDMDLLIARRGTWVHEGAAIERESLVRLFSTILRRDEDGEFYLVTPVEKWRIQVEDAPFLAVLVVSEEHAGARELRFTTNVGDEVTAGAEHPIRVDYVAPDAEPAPYVHVRGRLWALISRNVFLELADAGEERVIDGARHLGVCSQGQFFSLGRLD
jgi:hypothetical protein